MRRLTVAVPAVPCSTRQGEVIGIVSNILTRSGGFEGLGVAATAKMARRLLLERKPFWPGVEGILIQGDLAESAESAAAGRVFGPTCGGGVSRWAPGDQAWGIPHIRRGSDLLLGGDIILAVNGIDLLADDAALDRIYARMSTLESGERVVTRVLRAGQVIELSTSR